MHIACPGFWIFLIVSPNFCPRTTCSIHVHFYGFVTWDPSCQCQYQILNLFGQLCICAAQTSWRNSVNCCSNYARVRSNISSANAMHRTKLWPTMKAAPLLTMLQFTSLISCSFSIIIVDIIVCHCSHTCRNDCKEFPHGTCMVHHRAICCACVFGRARVVDELSSSVRNVQKRRGEKSEENQAYRQKKKRKIEIGTLIKKAEIR